MKKKSIKTVLLLFYFLVTPFLLLSQGLVLTRDSGNVVGNSNASFIHGNHLPDSFLKSEKVIEYSKIEGSPYVNNNSGIKEQLPIGKIYTAQNKYIGTSFVRYNAYTDQMEVSLVDDGVDYYNLKKKSDFLYIVLRKKKYRAFEYKEGSNSKINYFVILSETDTASCTFLKKETVLFKKETAPESSFLDATPAHFIKIRDTHHLRFIDGRLVNVPKKNKDFLKLFVKNQEKIKIYLQEHKLKVKNENHVLSIINYYNSLTD